MAAPAVITLVPASARAAASTLNCRVPFPPKVNKGGESCGPQSWGNGNSDAEITAGNGSDNGGGGGGGSKCFDSPGEFVDASEIEDIRAKALRGGDDWSGFERYQAYAKYLEKVQRHNLAGASCLMSIDLGNAGGLSGSGRPF